MAKAGERTPASLSQIQRNLDLLSQSLELKPGRRGGGGGGDGDEGSSVRVVHGGGDGECLGGEGGADQNSDDRNDVRVLPYASSLDSSSDTALALTVNSETTSSVGHDSGLPWELSAAAMAGEKTSTKRDLVDDVMALAAFNMDIDSDSFDTEGSPGVDRGEIDAFVSDSLDSDPLDRGAADKFRGADVMMR